MPLLTTNHTCLAIDGDDLVVASVRTSPTGVTVEQRGRIASFLSPGEAHDSSLTTPESGARITLVIPGAWCASRPMPLTTQRWEKSRAEVLESIDSIFPLSPQDALVQFIQLAPPTDPDQKDNAGGGGVSGGVGGVLFAISHAQLAPWIERIEQHFGCAPDTVVSSHAALLGVGLQNQELSIVAEPDAVGAPMHHTLRAGLPDSFDEPESQLPRGASRFALPGVDPEQGVTPIDAFALAQGAPIAAHIAPGVVSPFVGKRSSAAKRFAIPAALTAAALLILATSQFTASARLDDGLADLRVEQALLSEQVDTVQRLRQETERYIRDTKRIAELTADPGAPMLSIISAAHEALPSDGYLYRATITPESVELRGQCAAVGDLLRELEASAAFTNAQRLSPSAPVKGGSTFDIAASVTEALSGEGN